MLFATKEKPHQKQTQISAEEAHRLWAKAQTRYAIINQLLFIKNYVHDLDFQVVLDNLKSMYQKHCQVFEKKMKEFSIKSPEPCKSDIKAIVNQESLSDKHIARTIFALMQNGVSECIQALYNGTYNDNIRELLVSLMKEEIEKFYEYTDYITLKGWLETPPLYPNVKENINVGANVIWLLWEHLDWRYLNIQQTKIMRSNAFDQDFQLILDMGLEILAEQVNKLEKLLMDYGISLPEKYPQNIPVPESRERFDDKYLFSILIHSMQHATTIHGYAIRELVINNRPRKLFLELLFDEINYIDKLIRYGKVKCWMTLVPVYRS